MKLYYFPVAPNPTRVLVYVQEKGIDIERQQVNLRDGEQNSPEHLARNPRGALPVLELDDGRFITESVPIMEYLEECYPEPPMIGTSASERAFTRERERLAEMRVLNPTARLVHATNSPLGLPPDPAIAEVERERAQVGWQIFDAFLAGRDFVIGERVSIADCTLFAGLYMGEFFGVNPEEEYRELLRWYEAFKLRPGAQVFAGS
jgi:glutathione S-transferase